MSRYDILISSTVNVLNFISPCFPLDLILFHPVLIVVWLFCIYCRDSKARIGRLTCRVCAVTYQMKVNCTSRLLFTSFFFLLSSFFHGCCVSPIIPIYSIPTFLFLYYVYIFIYINQAYTSILIYYIYLY